VLLNQRFHTLLYTANPDGTGMPLVESLWLQLGPCMRIAAGHACCGRTSRPASAT